MKIRKKLIFYIYLLSLITEPKNTLEVKILSKKGKMTLNLNPPSKTLKKRQKPKKRRKLRKSKKSKRKLGILDTVKKHVFGYKDYVTSKIKGLFKLTTYPARKFARWRYMSDKMKYIPLFRNLDKQTEIKKNLLDQQTDDLQNLTNTLNVLHITIEGTFKTMNEKLEALDENLEDVKMKIEDEE